MHYNGLFGILDGLEEDRQKLIETINKMEEATTKSNETSQNKYVIISHNGKSLYYRLDKDDISFDGYIPFRDIYYLLKNKDEKDYVEIICGLIESAVVIKYFS